jgi:hypothetical protein
MPFYKCNGMVPVMQTTAGGFLMLGVGGMKPLDNFAI